MVLETDTENIGYLDNVDKLDGAEEEISTSRSVP